MGKPKPVGCKSQRSMLRVSKLAPFASQGARMPDRMKKGGGKAEWLLTRQRKSRMLIKRDIQRPTSCLEPFWATFCSAELLTWGKSCSLMCNSPFKCCGHCHLVMIGHYQEDINSVLFAPRLKIVEGKRKGDSHFHCL